MSRRPWTDVETAQLLAQYPHMGTKLIAAMLERPLSSTYQRALAHGVKKDPIYLASPGACRLRSGDVRGAAFRFPKGHVPANKGVKRGKGWAPGRMAEGQFKPGVRQGVAVKLYKPIGTLRVTKDGYLSRKVNDDLPLQRRWKLEHVRVWEEANGPVPAGHAVKILNGEKQDVRLENLALMSRADLMRRNSFHRYPQPIPQLIQLRGALVRQINRKAKREQDRGSEVGAVRHVEGPARQGEPHGHRAGQGGRGGRQGDRGHREG
jgi:hypothetical protein